MSNSDDNETNRDDTGRMIWVTIGKTQHPATLIERNSDQVHIQWASTLEREWIASNIIIEQLSPRRGERIRYEEEEEEEEEELVGSVFHSAKKRSSTGDSQTFQVGLPPRVDASSVPKQLAFSRHADQKSPLIQVREGEDSSDDEEVQVLLTIRAPSPSDKQEIKESTVANDSKTADERRLSVDNNSHNNNEGNGQPGNYKVMQGSGSAPKLFFNNTNTNNESANRQCDAASVNTSSAKEGANLDDDKIRPGFTMKQSEPPSTYITPMSVVTAGCQPLSVVENSANLVESEDDLAIATPTASTRSSEKYTLVSSAYLQNLAEMCHDILNDARWRTGKGYNTNSHLPLFRWEHGDDLSAAAALARHFHRPPARIRFPCTCVLCGNNDKEEEKAEPEEDVSAKLQSDQAVDTVETRALYLYCRLFYRKGPWFRVDDVYKRYYAPAQRQLKQADGTNNNRGPVTTTNLNQSGRFQPAARLKNENRRPVRINDGLLRKHYDRTRDLIRDLDYLLKAGLLRSCSGEEECGRSVAHVILKADERTHVLSKLGASKKRRDSVSNKTGTKKQRISSTKNEIWKQMTQQRTVFSCFTGRSVLPVRRHVDDAILSSLVKHIVAGSYTEGNPCASVQRETFSGVRKAIDLIVPQVVGAGGKICSCFRLREPPMLTLQRIARLHICASSGPGQMRGDGTNGWKSLYENNATPPLARNVLPPGQRAWNTTVYPGLSQRFGLVSYPFQDAYKPETDSAIEGVSIFKTREEFLAWEAVVEVRAQVDYLLELNDLLKYNARRRARNNVDAAPDNENGDSVDFLGIAEFAGFDRTVASCCVGMRDISLERSKYGSDIHKSIMESCSTECEKLLGSYGYMAMEVLGKRAEELADETLKTRMSRPWLRHLWWDGCMACVLWDTVPIFEKAGLHEVAVMALSLLLFGKYHKTFAIENIVRCSESQLDFTTANLVSRRTRSKLVDRLVVDLKHVLQSTHKGTIAKEKKQAIGKTKHTIAEFCSNVIEATVPFGTLTFSMIRGLARRLEAPLTKTLATTDCIEAAVIGLRYGEDPCDSLSAGKTKYVDWIPITDTAVATALQNDDKETVGSRCAYIGNEDNDGPSTHRSLNVEELAIEFYSSGRLPATLNEHDVKGGWHGFHDEGGNVRALFRILSAAPILGMDWGCGGMSSNEDASVFLTRWQLSPLDLHVAHELVIATDDGGPANRANSFYSRHRTTISKFLDKIAGLDPQELCNAVYEACSARLRFSKANVVKDEALTRDISRLRTLSFLAAAYGGKLLSSIFRCFLYDYRHYSGGLPDCLLVRARVGTNLIDLAEWIGEGFSRAEEQTQQQALSMLADKDDEFLGCSKISDSTGGGNRGRSSRQSAPTSNSLEKQSALVLPPRLVLVRDNISTNSNGSSSSGNERAESGTMTAKRAETITAECMLVEVKSSNDRLDSRQEDWLNVLDRCGDARVCKFVERSKRSKT